MDLKRWRLNTEKHTNSWESAFNFIINTPNDFVTMRRSKQKTMCTFERFSKKTIDEFVLKWSQAHLREMIPFDILGLYEEILEKQEDFEQIKDYMIGLVEYVHSYPIDLNE